MRPDQTSRRRRLLAGLLLTLPLASLLPGCGPGEGVVIVTVVAEVPVNNVSVLRATTGISSFANDFPLDEPSTVSLAKPLSFALRFEPGNAGRSVGIEVTAFTNQLTRLASGSTSGVIQASEVVMAATPVVLLR